MFRCAVSAVRAIKPLTIPYLNAARIISVSSRNFGYLTSNNVTKNWAPITTGSLINNKQVQIISNNLSPIQVRTVTKFSLKKGKRKASKSVVKRFLRLHWGGWIRTKVGRQKRLWKKTKGQRRMLKEHVICNATQSTLLDKMVTKFWKRPKYYVEDPYTPYHTREEFWITKKKPIDRN